MLGYLSLDIICSSKRTVFLELRSRKTVRFSEQIMSADKYPSIFSRQMKAIVYIYLLYLIWSRNTSAIKRTENICSSEKNGRQKPFWTGIVQGRNRCLSGRVFDPEVFNKTIILLGLAGFKTTRRLSITSYPARPLIVK